MGSGAYIFIDVSRKQEFIFKQNELKASLFRSFIIKSLTEDLSQDKDLRDIDQLSYSTLNRFLVNGQWEHRFVFSGGGNSILYFSKKDDARAFIHNYAIEVLQKFPELELYMSLVDETPGLDDQAIRDRLHQDADRLKDRREGQFRRWSYGIEKIDATGMPIRKLTPEQRKKHEVEEKEVQRWLMAKLKRASKDQERTYFNVTNELQEYRKNRSDSDIGKSYIGIIAIDGNQMGEIVSQVANFEELWEFGRWIETVYDQAVCAALRDMGDPKLPVTPVVMAGDDVCLITNAEYALELAQKIVQHIMELSAYPHYLDPKQRSGPTISQPLVERLKSLGLDYLSACAGIAITRITYPFYESVKAAEDLCKRAKEKIYTVWTKDDKGAMPSFMDWSIVLGQVDPAERYERMVRRMNIQEQFHIKPLQIVRSRDTPLYFTYGDFQRLSDRLIGALQKSGQHTSTGDISRDGAISHSALEKVRRAAYDGPDAYRQLFRNDQTGQLRWLKQCVEECLVPEKFSLPLLDTVAPIIEEKELRKVTYVLHDVLEVLPYMRGYWLMKSAGKGGDDHAAS